MLEILVQKVLEILVLKIEDPGCFWVIIKGSGNFSDNEVDYQKLNSAMNNFYDSMCQDIEIKPLVLEEGQVCVVYCQELKCWCRAIIKSIVSSADHYLAECFLVDFAKFIPVKLKNIRVAVESFMKLPYRAKKFRLYCTKPVTLHIDFCEDSAQIVPAKKWDSAAIQYFQSVLRAATQVEAKLCAVEDDTFEVYLYATIKNEKVCLNDDLVAKNFAYYMSPMQNKKCDSLEKPRFSIKSTSLSNPALTLWPMLWQGKDFQATNNSHGLSFLTQSLQHSLCKDVAGDRGPTAVILDKAMKCDRDPLRDSPEKTCDAKQRCISLREVTRGVESSVDWPTKRGITIYADPDIPAASALNQKPNEKPQRLVEKKDYDEKNGCVKLLQFLNPDPLRADGISDLQQLQKLTLGTQHPVMVLRNKIEPCLTIDKSPLSADLKKALQRKKFQGPSPSESFSWPPIARGCDVVVISHSGNDPLLYLPPLLTVLQIGGCYKSLPSRNGPLAVIVCPRWRKAQFIFELLGDYNMSSRPLHPVLLTIGLHKDEAKNMKLPRGCDVIVTTPHSLLRLLTYQSLLFLRLCHLVLDEVEVLFSEANEQTFAILDNFKKNVEVEERESAPRQVVAVGAHWSQHVEHLVQEVLNDPYIVISAPEEAALYGGVQQVVHLCLECEKTSTLLQVLDFMPSQAQKTLIFTCSVAETEIVCKVVESNSIFCLKMHKELVFNLKSVLEQWKKKLSCGSHIVLASTEDCLPLLAITDATCVVHFSFPSSPKVFGGRLYCMSDHFQSLTQQGSPVECGDRKTKSVLLLTERNASHAVGVLRYLERADAKIPSELYEFSAGVLEAKEDKKTRRPLCRHLKAFGFCKDKRICPDRHHVNPELDMPRKLSEHALPKYGYIQIIPSYISNATNYFGRIIDKHVDLYATLKAEMNEYFKDSSNKVAVEKVETLGLYGLEEKTLFHRVQVLETSQKDDTRGLGTVLVTFLDEGRTGLVTKDQLLRLPESFHTLPPQAVELIVCRVKPADSEMEWNPKVTRYIHHKIVGKLHDAKVVLALGNTVWIDPMVHVTKLPNLKTSIIDYNVRAEILSTGMGIDNSEHVQQLKTLCKETDMPASDGGLGQTTLASNGESVSGKWGLEDSRGERGTAASGAGRLAHLPSVLSHQPWRTACGGSHRARPPCPRDPPEGISPASPSRVTSLKEEAAVPGAQQEDAPEPGKASCSSGAGSSSTTDSTRHSLESESAHTGDASARTTAPPREKSFHPQIKWFQKEDVVILKIRVRDVRDYRCKYFQDRVVFSASVGDKVYLADLELQANIVKDDCRCVIKNHEPVITLTKEKKEPWRGLLKRKNPNVAFDFDHWEDCEEESPFAKVAHSRSLWGKVAEVVESSRASSEEAGSESE
ncbi:putative ATP-dependent RNA helicase TDRD12 [Perognathus longimembris pacificus]|uniref:putative ATP-dependent RNA helicase TDRD12 n=1 Tax=Perognathus longimembris pacificus TaxID=214514 RepID=UPI002019FCBB|nr:putative ATP-dependent RNA helicase TDRD12 [Perognathus longimembris pacificus]